MFGNLTLRKRWNGWNGKQGASRSSAPAVRLDPVGDNLPEQRSKLVQAGNLTSGEILNILAPPAASGARVNQGTALGVSAVYACVRLLSDMVAKLPVELYRESPKGPVRMTNHPAARVMQNDRSELHTSFELRKLMMTGKGLGGNGYARVFRNEVGDPRALQWVEPCSVRPEMVQRPSGERFVVYHIEGQPGTFTRYDLVHIRGECRDGMQGASPVALMRESIGTSLAQTEAAGRLMQNGTNFPGYLHTSANLSKDQISDARKEWDQNYSGSLNAGRPPILNGTFDFKQTNGMSMVDAQFIESRRFELQEVARHYGIPSHLIGDSTASTTWGTGIQEQTLGFLNFCLDPHLRNFEESLAASLLTTAEIEAGFYFRFDRDELASVSRQDTAAYFQTMRNIGVYSVNDIRRKLDEPTLEASQGGDDYRLPLNSSSSGSVPVAEEEPETVED